MKQQGLVPSVMPVVCGFLLMAFLWSCSSVDFQGKRASSMMWDFEEAVGSEWSTDRTFEIGKNKVLGLFNDQSQKYPSAAILRLSHLPENTPVALSFDLYFIGTWDSGGKLADRWTLSIRDGDTLIDMNRFHYAFRDGTEAVPNSKTGSLDTGRRILNYWTVDHQVTIAPHQIKGGSLSLVFRGYLTGRGTEFWALDDVRVTTGRAQ